MGITEWFAIGLVVLLIFTYIYFRIEDKKDTEIDKQRRLEKWKRGEDVTSDNSLWWW